MGGNREEKVGLVETPAEAETRMRSSAMAPKLVLEYAGVVVTVKPDKTADPVIKDSALKAYRDALVVVRDDFWLAVGVAKLAKGVVAKELPLTTDALVRKLEEVCEIGINHGSVTISRATEKE